METRLVFAELDPAEIREVARQNPREALYLAYTIIEHIGGGGIRPPPSVRKTLSGAASMLKSALKRWPAPS